MSNDYYNHGSVPINRSLAQSALIRTEFDNVMAGFAKLPALTGNAYKPVIVNSAGTALGVAGWKVYGGFNDTSSVAVGTNALALANTGGIQNTAIGAYAMSAGIVSSFGNVAVGYQSLLVLTSGSGNSGVGAGTLKANTTGSANTAVGSDALGLSVAASNNTAVGGGSMYSRTAGDGNVAVGNASLYANAVGAGNVAIGFLAARYFTGDAITAIGYQALYNNLAATLNTAIGYQALMATTTGSSNTAVGHSAMIATVGGFDNTAVGRDAMKDNTAGNSNTAVGVLSAWHNIDGDNNVAIGHSSLRDNTAGNRNVAIGVSAAEGFGGDGITAIGYKAATTTSGAGNTAIGYQALLANITGEFNTAVGYMALATTSTTHSSSAFGYEAATSSTGTENAAFGYRALYGNGAGFGNTAVGANALASNVTGSNNVAVGNTAGPTVAGLDNTVAIGAGAEPTSSNQVVIGNENITETVLRGQVRARAGAGAGQPVMVGTMNVNTNAVGNIGVGTDDLMFYSLPENSLSANGKGVRITAWGNTLSNANAKTLALLFGATTVVSAAMTTNIVNQWKIVVEIIRTGSGAQIAAAQLVSTTSAGALQSILNSQSTPAETDTAGITIKCTGSGATDNDIVQKGMIVEFFN